MEVIGTTPWMGDDSTDAYTEVGGTTPWTGEVEQCLEQLPRYDYMEVIGRVEPGHSHGCEW